MRTKSGEIAALTEPCGAHRTRLQIRLTQQGQRMEPGFPESTREAKLGSNLGPFAPEYHAKTEDNTQNKPKRDNRLVHRLLVRDQGLGGSNPIPLPSKSQIINE